VVQKITQPQDTLIEVDWSACAADAPQQKAKTCPASCESGLSLHEAIRMQAAETRKVEAVD